MNKYAMLSCFHQGETDMIRSCLGAEKKSFRKNDIIMKFSDWNNNLGIVEKGTTFLVSLNDKGEPNILDYYEEGDIFGRILSPNTNVNLYYIYAKRNCEISIFAYDNLHLLEQTNRELYQHFFENMFSSTVRRNQMHIDILAQRTIRDKLMTYLKYISEMTGKTEFSIPISLSDLADYLSVDRSSMMREIKKMNNELIINSKGTKIIIL